MADGTKAKPARTTRRRSKSASSPRLKHPYELKHTVSLTEKQGIVKKKNKKELEVENIALDSAKHVVEDQLKDVQNSLQKATEKNSDSEKGNTYLQNQLEKIEREKDKIGRDLKGKIDEFSKQKTEFYDERAIFRKEKSSLIAELEESRQENKKLRTRYDEEKAKLEEEKREQMEMLADERTEHWKFTNHFIKLLEDSPAKVYVTGCTNVQVGSSNIIKQDIMTQWKELTDKLCVSIEDHIIKRTELEMKVRTDEVCLKEIKDTLQKVLDNLDKTTSKRLGHDKDLLEFLIYDRSDERIFTTGIKELKNHIAISKGRKKFPLEAEAAVTRLLNKFDSLSLNAFVEVLEGKKERSESLITPDDADQTKKKEVFIEKMESIQVEKSRRDAPLNRASCVNVLVQWLQLSEDNDAEQLLGRIKVYESKLSTERVSQFQEEIKHKHISNNPDERQLCAKGRGLQEKFETPYKSPSSTHSMQGLPDALSQFMHQLEGLKIVIDIDRKVDHISDVLKTLGAAVNKKENNDSQGSTHDSRPVSNFKRQCSDV